MEIGKYYKNTEDIEGRYNGEGFLVWEKVEGSSGVFTPSTLVFVTEELFGGAEELAEGAESQLIPL